MLLPLAPQPVRARTESPPRVPARRLGPPRPAHAAGPGRACPDSARRAGPVTGGGRGRRACATTSARSRRAKTAAPSSPSSRGAGCSRQPGPEPAQPSNPSRTEAGVSGRGAGCEPSSPRPTAPRRADAALISGRVGGGGVGQRGAGTAYRGRIPRRMLEPGGS